MVSCPDVRAAESDKLLSAARLYHEGQAPESEKEKRSHEKMAEYAKIYGITTYTYNQIRGNAGNYIRLSADCYIPESYYDYLEELLDKES